MVLVQHPRDWAGAGAQERAGARKPRTAVDERKRQRTLLPLRPRLPLARFGLASWSDHLHYLQH